MIRIFLGKPGAGKSLSAIKEIWQNRDLPFISNIHTPAMPNNIPLSRGDMVKEIVTKVKKDGTKVTKLELNKDFWLAVKDQMQDSRLNIVLDEIHTMWDARRAGSSMTKVMNDFVALIRKILSDRHAIHGNFTIITQLDRRIDIVGLELATQIRYFRSYYKVICTDCGVTWSEDNEAIETYYRCPRCRSLELRQFKHRIHCWWFSDARMMYRWMATGDEKQCYKHTIMKDPRFYYDKYETMQWEDLIS
jgi:DNA-directed RNA polymerase subunit RPC12/RpoP